MLDNNKMCLKIETEEKLLSKLNILCGSNCVVNGVIWLLCK